MIRLTRKRLIVTAVVLFLLTGVLLITWEVCDWPPVRLILKHGLPPAGGPTGEHMTIEGIDFVKLSPGYFRWGSHFCCEEGDALGQALGALGLPFGDRGHHEGVECPTSWVEVPRAFWIATKEVTNYQYEDLAPDHARPPASLGPRHPVEAVSWLDALSFCAKFARRYDRFARLPTQLEWEYACRAGTVGEYHAPVTEHSLCEYAVFSENSSYKNHPDGVECGTREVGSLRPNAWGLFDMHGNVSEWCDRAAPAAWLPARSHIACPHRGGGWRVPAKFCRVSYVGWMLPDVAAEGTGFRLVIDDEWVRPPR